MLQPKILSIRTRAPYFLILEYENHEKRIFDVSPYISGSWFEELKDEQYFRTVQITQGGVGIEWAHGQDIAPHELYEMSVRITDKV